jgi:branched-chain amino acid transport system permease protein
MTRAGGAEPVSVPVRRWNRAATVTVAGAVAAVLALAVVPFAFGGPAEQPLVTLLTLAAMAGLWNLLAGFSGLTSIGQQAYLGLGAYALYLAAAHGVNPYLGVLVAAAVAAVTSLPVSALVLRLAGGYFAIATWVVAEVFEILATLSPSVGGNTGVSIPGLASYSPILRQALTYWVTLAVTMACLAGVYLLVRTRLGLDTRAVASDPVAAAATGIRVGRTRRLTYLVAALGAGAVGGVLALQTLYVEPSSIFSVQYSVDMLFMVLIGGMGTIEGPVVGALVLFALQEMLSGYGAWYLVIVGGLAGAVTLLAPQGLWGTVAGRWGWSLLPVGYRIRACAVPAGGSSATELPGETNDITQYRA